MAMRAVFGRHHRELAAVCALAGVGDRQVVRAGLRAAGADRGVFDDLVEMGLADGALTARVVRGLTGALLGR
jgi:hypothetical protein